MKKIVTITVEKGKDGYRVSANPGGDQLPPLVADDVSAVLCEYWMAVGRRAKAVERLRTLKAQRKEEKRVEDLIYLADVYFEQYEDEDGWMSPEACRRGLPMSSIDERYSAMG